MKKILVAIVVLAIAGVAGVYFGSREQAPTTSTTAPTRPDESAWERESTPPPPVVMKKPFYKSNSYWNGIKDKNGVSHLYAKAHQLFSESPNAEDVATWIAMGAVMDSSQEYGELLMHSLREINSNPDENFALLAQKIDSLTPNDSFMRGQFLNLANQIEVESEKKVQLFGKELSREIALDSNGKMTPDALNVTTAIIFMKANTSSVDQVREFAIKGVENNSDPVARQKLIIRLQSYFPSLADELSNYQ